MDLLHQPPYSRIFGKPKVGQGIQFVSLVHTMDIFYSTKISIGFLIDIPEKKVYLGYLWDILVYKHEDGISKAYFNNTNLKDIYIYMIHPMVKYYILN